jgi:uncharacterized protein YndB with AHSA1/START domain/uncharacterized glyoxalase superfamily protein PhnB
MMKPLHNDAGVNSVSPLLVCPNAADAMEFYKRAFGAEEMMRLPAADGKLLHGCLRINGSTVMVTDEFPAHGALGPHALRGTPVTVHLLVEDADTSVAEAAAQGAKIVHPVQPMFWGDRYGVIEDPFGHRWSLGTPQAPTDPQALKQKAAAIHPPSASAPALSPIDPARDLLIERTLGASRVALWRCWTEPALMTRWFTPPPWQTVSAEVDLRPGGASVVVMRGPDGQEAPHRGVYLDVRPYERLVSTDAYVQAWEPAEKPFMTLELTFADAGENRTVYRALARHWTEEDRAAHEAMGFHQGWGVATEQLEALARSLDKGEAA